MSDDCSLLHSCSGGYLRWVGWEVSAGLLAFEASWPYRPVGKCATCSPPTTATRSGAPWFEVHLKWPEAK